MNKFRSIAVGVALALVGVTPALSSPITAQVEFFSYNGGGTFQPLTEASEATYAALTGSSSGAVFSHYTFNYTGELNWQTTSAANTVGDFILGAGGTISGISNADLALLLEL